jgi:arylamine N-acetyltransferase
MQAVEFFETWINHGTGGTCWPMCNALFELAHSLGFEAYRIAGCMNDQDDIGHGSVRVTIDGSEWLVDASTLTNVPLPLNDKVFVSSDPVFAAEVEPVGATHVLWLNRPHQSAYMRCRLFADPVDYAYCFAAYKRSRMRSPFNQQLYPRHNRPGELLLLLGHTRYSKTADGLQSRDLSSEEVIGALHEDIGISREMVEQWVRAEGLEATFEPTQGRKPPPIMQKPPSQR